ncbi:MAG: hypothetical protein LQ347_003240 [Umbilicaria vellea]|nr:MAG: hypothetical protein LQ347_003240 [Umbilicaria vellea]
MAGLRDNVSRTKASSPLGTSLFVGLRAADAVLQYNILRQGWGQDLVRRLGGTAILSTNAAGGILGLHPYYAAISALALGSSVKQSVHLLFVSEQEMPPASALGISFFNTIINTANTLLSLWAISSMAPNTDAELSSSPTFLLGVSMYVVGMLTEAISEFQRKAFKADSANRGKPYGGGLFSLATNINYGGYTIWRAGYAITAAGLPWGIVVGSWFFYDFATRGVPVLDQYCTERVSFRLILSALELDCGRITRHGRRLETFG